jgi:rare lipoprotein A
MDKDINNTSHGKAGYAAVSLTVCLFVSACSSLPKGELSLDLGIKDRGVASWYGKEFHGKLAANGEVFDMTAYTAAHRKLPLGSVVRVINLENGKSLQVRITDRGPYVMGRMLDLSHAAARELGMMAAGTAAVQIEVVGNSYLVRSLPPGQLSTGMYVPSESGPAKKHPPSGKGIKTRPVPVRMMPQEALYVRRERRTAVPVTATANSASAMPEAPDPATGSNANLYGFLCSGPHGSAAYRIGPGWNDRSHRSCPPPDVRPFDPGRPTVNPWQSRNPYLPPWIQQTPGYRSPQQSSLW